jgi:hypothetical protein
MLQQAREQQRLQQQPPVLPPGTPQPKEQPQGIDALATNVGEAYAEGGIIGHTQHFDGQTSSFVKDLGAFADRLKGAFTETDEDKAARLLAQKLQQEGAPIGYFTKGSEEYDKKSALRAFIGDNPTVLKNPAFQADPVAFMEKSKNVNTVQDVNASKSSYVPNAQADAMETNKLFNLAATSSAPAVVPTKANAPQPPVNQGIAGGGGGKAPSVQAALDKAGIISLPVSDAAQKRMMEIANMNPDEQERLAQEKFKQQVGNKDLSIYDKTAAELQARKEKLNAPKTGYDATMEYLGQIAMGGGRTSVESGSIGANRQRQLQLSREAQQNELMDKILELGAKKSDAEYNQKLNLYQVGQKRYEDVFKNVMDATKDMRMSETERMKMAQQAVIAQMDNDAKLAAARIGAGGRDDLAARAAAIRAENKGMSVEESIKRAAMATYAGQTAIAEGKNDAATEKKIADTRAAYAKTMKFLSPDSPLFKRQQAMMEQDVADIRRSNMGGSGLPDAVPTKKPEGVTVTKIGS